MLKEEFLRKRGGIILGAALIGVLAQRTRFCTVGWIRSSLFHGERHLLIGMVAFVAAAFALAGGCPGRQLIAAGEGNGDAGIFILGSLAGVALAHNLALAGIPDKAEAVGGVGPFGKAAVVVGILFCVAVGMLLRRPSRGSDA